MLTADEIKQHDEHATALKAAASSLEDAIDNYNTALEEAKDQLESELVDYNRELQRAQHFVETLSAKYNDSETIDNWATWLDLSEQEIQFPPELKLDLADPNEFAALELDETEEA
jgi:predicted RNase H-like nuclease (RuvC/YqgF family)